MHVMLPRGLVRGWNSTYAAATLSAVLRVDCRPVLLQAYYSTHLLLL